MAEPNITPPPPAPPPAKHEVDDVNVRAILWFGVGLALLGVVIHFAIGGLTAWFRAMEQARQPAASAMSVERPRLPRDLRRVREPRLQMSNSGDLEALRRREDELLHRYGWADRKAGTVRIPIERAMELLIAKGKS